MVRAYSSPIMDALRVDLRGLDSRDDRHPAFVDAVACDLRALVFEERRALDAALVPRVRATRVERAATGRIERVRNLARHRRAGFAGHGDVGDRALQHARVRVQRALEE